LSIFQILRGDSSRINLDTTPFHDGFAYFTPDDGGFYIDAEMDGEQRRIQVNSAGGGTEPVEIVLTATGWSGRDQTVSITGVTATQDGIAGVPQTISGDEYQAVTSAGLRVSGQGDGTVTFTCEEDVPQINVPVLILLFH
jgi:hypothetical protein